ncbi:FIST signal transduction protein [Salinimonas lutimaris]|uniref:FIST signal transduction protein n=1 Tax=Salinimonas lutimaris TaxID=914153 RepID=UPI0010C09194|nr:FIST N-terminal domain-containing protein [Salinimonas lutimaris]
MQVRQCVLTSVDTLTPLSSLLSQFNADLILVFADQPFLVHQPLQKLLRQSGALVAGCSTAGEIAGMKVLDHQAVITAIKFSHSQVSLVSTSITDMPDSHDGAARLAAKLESQDLRAVLVLATGLNINGSGLISGLQQHLPEKTLIFGGLAGDYAQFSETFVLGPDGPHNHCALAIGFYGEKLHITNVAAGGWQPFGPYRKVTRASENILYELDGQPALDIYKSYLGEYAQQLPSSGLLFPLEMVNEARESCGLVRTILDIDEQEGSLTLAGDVMTNGYLRLMFASNEGLTGGAEMAARLAAEQHPHALTKNCLILLISCVGRKVIMGDLVEDEIDSVVQLNPAPAVTGFYSYGEIGAHKESGQCVFHNQTMTVSLITEVS